MKIVETGILARGVADTARAVLSFPSVVSLSDGTVLALFRAGSRKDSDDEAIELCRSLDGGRTWSEPRRCFEAPVLDGRRGTLKVCYLTELAPGHLLAASMWVDRETYPGQPLFNAETEGCLPMVILLADSYDFGQTWTPWRRVPMPDDAEPQAQEPPSRRNIGPASLTNPILKLPDGTLAMSVETNKHYHDASKWYQRVVLFHSHDGGQTWEGPVTASQDPSGRIFYWDQRAGVAPDGRIAAFLWTYDSETLTYLNIHRRLSPDGGFAWLPLEDLGFADQASHPAILPDGRVVLAWVDRFRSQSIRARLAPSVDAAFDPQSEVLIYAHTAEQASADDDTGELLAGMSLWTFGLPYAEVLPDGDVLVVYYAGSESTMDVRWARLQVAAAP